MPLLYVEEIPRCFEPNRGNLGELWHDHFALSSLALCTT
jgi:hypothetical protein